MSVEAYPNNSTLPADLYILKAGVAITARDVLVKTGNIVNDRIEIDKMGASYKPEDVIGISAVEIAADYPYRTELTILVKGPAIAKVAKDVEPNEALMGAASPIVEYFSGDGTAQQIVYVGNVPVDSVTSLVETGGPTTLTRVTGTPTTDEYYLDDETGKLIIGGTSVSGTDNYVLTYSVDEGRLEPLIDWVEETLTVTTNVATMSYEPEVIEYVERTAGTATGATGIITAGTVAAGEVKLDRSAKTLTFAAADAVTETKVRYKTTNRSCARALEAKTAGELTKVFYEGVKA